MTISIQRGRQFAVGESPVFDEKGKDGGYLTKASDKLVAQKIKIQLGTTKLTTAAEWKAFIDENASSAKKADGFTAKFGISFEDFLNVIDDVAASPDTGLSLDLTAKGTLAKALSLDAVKDDYAAGIAKGAKVTLSPGNDAVAAGVNTITKEILKTAPDTDWQRDRSEQENWADFPIGNGAGSTFDANTGPQPYVKLFKPKWDDKEAMALVSKFTLPVRLEVDPLPNDGREPNLVIPDPEFPNDRSKDQKIFFQDGYENFRDTYYDDTNESLKKAGASVRARVRFDNKGPEFKQKDVRVQAKEGRVVDGSSSAVHKFEYRGLPDEDKAMQMLVSGEMEPGKPLNVAQKLYKLADEKGTLPADGNLTLLPKYTVLQKRRRTHLDLDDVPVLETRLKDLKAEAAKFTKAGKPVPKGLVDYQAKVASQIKFIGDASKLISKYGGGSMSTWGDAFIISADRYSVYDPTARKDKINQLKDETGLIGKGPLHIEAEWDSDSSDVFEKALAEMGTRIETAKKALAASPAPSATEKAKLQKELTTTKADLKKLTGMRDTIRKDIAAIVQVAKDQLVGAGLTLDTEKKSKDERANEIADSTKRPVYWP